MNMFGMGPPLDCLKDLSRNEARFRRAAMEVDMPRASWKGFLRLSLVSCPIYLSPATARTKSIRLHQVWQATRSDEADEMPDQVREQDVPKSAARFALDDADDEADQVREATRITLRPHDPSTGEEVEKEDVVKGYEYQRGQFVTFSPEELKALDVESSKVIDLEKFVPRGEIDPIYFNAPYYAYPDGPIAVEALRVIGAAMAEAGVVGIGRLTLSRRERMVMVEPRGAGMALFTLRAADRGSDPAVRQRRRRAGCRNGGSSRRDHQAADRNLRPEDVSRPLSRGVARADRGQDEGSCYQAERGGLNPTTRNRSDGGLETQPSRGGTGCEGRQVGQRQADQGGT